MKGTERVTEVAPESFRDVLMAAINVTDVSREELARRIGRSGAAISQWLNKGDMPDLAIVFKIEDALDLRPGALVRHHSPDVWLIIETKMGRGKTWPSWEQKFREALIEAPIEDMERSLIRSTMERYVSFYASRDERPGG